MGRRVVVRPEVGAGGELVQVVRHREDEQLLLGGEGAVDQRPVDAGRSGDLVDRRILHAALVEQPARHLDDGALARPAASACRASRDSHVRSVSGCVTVVYSSLWWWACGDRSKSTRSFSTGTTSAA